MSNPFSLVNEHNERPPQYLLACFPPAKVIPIRRGEGVEIVFQIIPFIDVIFGEKNKCVCSEGKKGCCMNLPA